MSETPGYDALARHYDPIYTGLRAASGDADWYRRLAREAAGAVLELGAGTGRVLLAMAAEGMPCVGLDHSQAMLDELRRKPLPSNVELVLGDMRSFALPRRFALIAAPFRVFQHLDAVDEQLSCLACVRRHLAPGGRLAFDVFAPDPAAIALDVHPETEDARYRDGGQEIVRHVTVRVERARQRIHLAIRHEKRRGTLRLGEDRSELWMRYFYRYELEHLLARAGFARVEILGGFRGEPLADDSRDFVVVADAGSS